MYRCDQILPVIAFNSYEAAPGYMGAVDDELRYEGFGPNGSMVIVDALTNNVNRTASDVRAAFGKNGGNMGVSGSVENQISSSR